MARILLIDDDPQVLAVFESFLLHDHHDVTTADSGKTAEKLIAANEFDLVITDIVMPDQDGFELIMSISKMENHPRIIAVSGGSPILSQHMLLSVVSSMPVDRVLAKPVSYEQLSAAVRSVLKIT